MRWQTVLLLSLFLISVPFFSVKGGESSSPVLEAEPGVDPEDYSLQFFLDIPTNHHDAKWLKTNLSLCEEKFALHQKGLEQNLPANSSPENSSVETLQNFGPYKIGSRQLTVPTESKTQTKGKPLSAQCSLYFPDVPDASLASGTIFPLIHVFHGAGGSDFLKPYLECSFIHQLVSHGFVVSTNMCTEDVNTHRLIGEVKETMHQIYGRDVLGDQIGLIGHSMGGADALQIYGQEISNKAQGRTGVLNFAGMALFAASHFWSDEYPLWKTIPDAPKDDFSRFQRGHILLYYEPSRDGSLTADSKELDQKEAETWEKWVSPLLGKIPVTAVLDEGGDHIRWSIENVHYYFTAFFKKIFSSDRQTDAYLNCKQPHARVRSSPPILKLCPKS